MNLTFKLTAMEKVSPWEGRGTEEGIALQAIVTAATCRILAHCVNITNPNLPTTQHSDFSLYT